MAGTSSDLLCLYDCATPDDDGIHEESELCTCEADVLATSKLYARELFEETITQVLEPSINVQEKKKTKKEKQLLQS